MTIQMDQISVCFPAETMAFLRRTAERECRTVGAQVRYYVEAARKAGGSMVERAPWPPPLPTVASGNLSDTKSRLAEMEAERDRLADRERKEKLGLLPHDEERLRYLRDTCKTIRSHVVAIERMMA